MPSQNRRSHFRPLVPVLLIGCALVASWSVFAGGAGGSQAHGPSKVQCGEERWPVKTLSDHRAHLVDFHPQATTVDALRHKGRPDVGTDSPRFPGVERTTFRVHVQLVTMVTEDDRDVHLVNRAAEAPLAHDDRRVP
jgi:hypothetical protein